MKTLVCIKSFDQFSIGDIISSSVQDNYTSNMIADGFAQLVNLPEGLDTRFIKAVFKESIPEKYKKNGTVYNSCPSVEDTSWTYVAPKAEVQEVVGSPEVLAVEGKAEVLEVLAQPEHWTKDGEDDVFVDPLDNSWEHHAAVEAVAYQPAVEAVAYKAAVAHIPFSPAIPEHWTKDGLNAVYMKPMMNDPSYEVIPAVAAGYVIEADIIAKENHDTAQAKQSQKDLGKKIRNCCDEMMDCIIGFNVMNLTSEEITQMQIDYKDISAAINGYRPTVAKGLIYSNVTFPELRLDLLDILNKYGF